MRSDSGQTRKFAESRSWAYEGGSGGEVTNVLANPEGHPNRFTAFSHSGNERNRLFLNQAGEAFSNFSSLSGADSILDGRACALADLNRDGFTDLIVVSANDPRLQIFLNRSPRLLGPDQGNVIGIRLKGASPSNLDAIGARVTVETEEGSILRALSAGEGFASQNSKVLLIGLGSARAAKSIRIIWPSGKVADFQTLQANRLYWLDEGQGFINSSPLSR